MSKKAVFIGPAHPYRGGIAAFNENLAAIFQKNGWNCKIFTFIQQYPNLFFPGKDQLAPENKKPDLSIQRAIYSTNPLNWPKISRQIVEEKPDIVITQYWMPFMAPAFGMILRGIKKSLPGVPTVTIVHNFKPHESHIGDKQLNKFIASRTDLMVSLSEGVYKDIQQNLPDKKVLNLFHPIYDHYGEIIAVNDAKAQLGLDESTVYLLFFGLIRAYKGLDILIKSLADIDTKKKFKLLIAGEFYEDEKKYHQLIEDLDLSDKIIIRNEYIPDSEVPLYFCAADAVVLPYKTATQSGVIPVAIHFERPVIVSAAGSLSDMITKYKIGAVCRPEPMDFSEKISDFINVEKRDKTDFSGIKSELSWQSFFNKFINQLEAFNEQNQKNN